METSPFFFAGEDYQQRLDGGPPLLPGEEQLRKKTSTSFTRLLRRKASIIKSNSRTSLRRITSKTGHPTSSPKSVAETFSFDTCTDASTPTSSIFLIPLPSPDVPYLQPELFARISTFATADQVGNLLVGVAPHSRNVATMIRTTYLKNNYAYLAYSWVLPYAKRRRNVSEWMKVNDDWRNLYDDPQARESRVFGLMFNNLLRATELGNVDIVRHLVEQRGADVNQEEQRADVEQRSPVRPIMIAFKLPDSDVLKYYLQEVKGLDLNYLVYPESGLRFLHQVVSLRHASRADHLELVVQKKDGVDINARVNNGMTVLHLFAGRKSMPRDAVVRLRCLLEAGADQSLRDDNGLTALQIFKERKDGKLLDKATRTRIKALLTEDF